MQVILLCAGKGSRLTVDGIPKPLTPLASGTTILDRQLELLSKYTTNIVLVVGYQQELFEPYLDRYNLIISPHFADENTAKSLTLALKYLPEEDTLWINGDVVFHPSVLELIMASKESAMIVTADTNVGDEEVKYHSDLHHHITEVSKTVSAAMGEAIGLNHFTKDDLPKLKKHLQKCAKNDYFERAIEMCIKDGVVVKALPIAPDLATEIDFPEDLVRANNLLKSW